MNSAVTLVDFDRMLNGLDHIYSEFSRTCGLSDCAYWMLVDTGTAGGSIAVSRLTSEWFYSKQTINSAIKTLTARDFATLEFAEGSRKNKVVRLTEAGMRFAERYAWMLNHVLTTERMLPLFDQMTETIRSEMPRQIARWGGPDELAARVRRVD